MTGIVSIFVGATMAVDEQIACIVTAFESPQKVVVREIVSGAERTVEITQLGAWPPAPKRPRADLTCISEKLVEQARDRYLAVEALIDKYHCCAEDVEAAARRAGVSTSTIYRWLKELRNGRVMSSLIRKSRSDKGQSRLTDQVEAILASVIAEYWMTPQKRSYNSAYREVERLCRSANVRAPSLPTLIERINRLDHKVATKHRHGTAKADKLNLIAGTVTNADRPYAVIQIDHTLVDIELVDSEHRLPIGRPWITVAIDVYSRMIVGWYISFDPPGMLGTGICIANAILSKSAWMASLGVEYDYPCIGKPRIIHLDNAKEFHSVTLDRACQEYGIDIQYRKIATPRYGGHIERLMGTMAGEIKALNGATFSNHLEKGSYDSAKRASFTLANFEKWLAHLFLGVYHERVHSALGESPLRRYTRSFLGKDDEPLAGVIEFVPDEQLLRLDFLPMFESTIQAYGVKIDHIRYSADVLRRWVGAKDRKAPTKNRKFVFRRDPRDISFIYFYDPDAQTHFKVPYRDLSHLPMSLWELRAVRAFMLRQGREAVNEAQIFGAFDAMRKIEEQELKATTRMRRSDAQKRALRRKESPQPKELTSTAPAVPSQDTPRQTFSESPEGLTPEISGFDEIERY